MAPRAGRRRVPLHHGRWRGHLRRRRMYGSDARTSARTRSRRELSGIVGAVDFSVRYTPAQEAFAPRCTTGSKNTCRSSCGSRASTGSRSSTTRRDACSVARWVRRGGSTRWRPRVRRWWAHARRGVRAGRGIRPLRTRDAALLRLWRRRSATWRSSCGAPTNKRRRCSRRSSRANSARGSY